MYLTEFRNYVLCFLRGIYLHRFVIFLQLWKAALVWVWKTNDWIEPALEFYQACKPETIV